MENAEASPEEGSRDKRVSSLALSLSADSELHQPYCNILSKTGKSTVQMAQVHDLEGGGRLKDEGVCDSWKPSDHSPTSFSIPLEGRPEVALGQNQIS